MVLSRGSALDKKKVELPQELRANITSIKHDLFRKSDTIRMLAKQCDARQVQIIQCNEEKDVAIANKIVEAGRWKRKPSIVLTRHVLNKCHKNTLKKIAAAISVSTPITKYLREAKKKIGNDSFRVVYIPPLYNIESFLSFVPPSKTRYEFFKETFNIHIQPEETVICMIANLYKSKNHALLLKAISKIKDKSIHLILAGCGPLERRLKSFSRRLKIDDRTHFVGFTNKVPEILFYSNINMLPSKKEGLGVAVLEASLMKKPSIVSSGNGSSDIVVHEKTGLVFKNNDLRDCIEKIRYMIDNPKVASSIGIASYNHVKEEFSTHKNFQRYVDLYNSLSDFVFQKNLKLTFFL